MSTSEQVSINIETSSLEENDEELLMLSSSEDDPTPMSGFEQSIENSEDEFEFPHPKLAKQIKRTLYGGGKHARLEKEEGKLSKFQVAGMILSSLGASPLLIAHSARLLGLPLFLTSMFLLSLLSFESFVVLGVCKRYSGAKSWLALSSAVLPHRFKLHKVGEIIIALLISFISLSKGLVTVMAMGGFGVDIAELFIGSLGTPFSNKIVAIVFITLSYILIPLLYPFIRSKFFRRQSNKVASSQLSTTLTLSLYPLALIILGFRLPHLIRSSQSTPIPPTITNFESEAMGNSIWGGLSILAFALSSHHNHFRFLNILARPLSVSSETASSPSLTKATGRGNDWPLASAMGVAASLIISLAWGLTGFLAIPHGGKQGNILNDAVFRKDDGWILLVKSLVLAILISSVDESLECAMVRVRKGFKSVFGASGYSRVEINGEEREERLGWKRIWSRIIVWLLVGGLAIGMEFIKGGMVDVAEVVGCVGISIVAFIAPAITFIALFHLRRPRSIFVSDPIRWASDQLLMKKEREVQKRLSGRRISNDLAVFAGLLPFGVILLVRGCIALTKKEV